MEILKFDKETELYAAIKNYLIAEGYSVKAEVKDCDIMAEREGEFLIVELKLAFNLKLVFQVVERLKKCPNVVIAIPDYAYDNRSKRKASIKDLMKKLGVGVLTVSKRASGIYVTPELAIPKGKKRINKHFKKEFESRSIDLNTGGTTKQKIVTAYKERQIAIGALLMVNGAMRIRDIKPQIKGNLDSIFRRNFNQWFDKVATGTYDVTDTFKKEIEQYQPLYDFYYNKFLSFAENASNDD